MRSKLHNFAFQIGLISFKWMQIQNQNRSSSIMRFIIHFGLNRRVSHNQQHVTVLSFFSSPLFGICPLTGSYYVRLSFLTFDNHSTEQMTTCDCDNRMFERKFGSKYWLRKMLTDVCLRTLLEDYHTNLYY